MNRLIDRKIDECMDIWIRSEASVPDIYLIRERERER